MPLRPEAQRRRELELCWECGVARALHAQSSSAGVKKKIQRAHADVTKFTPRPEGVLRRRREGA